MNNIQQLEVAKHAEIIAEDKADPLGFFRRYFGDTAFTVPFVDMHKDMIVAILNPILYRLLMLAPRGTGKSTFLVFGVILWLSLFDSHLKHKGGATIYLVSKTLSSAIDRIGTLKWEIENNEAFRAVYGNLKGSKWGAEEIHLYSKELGIDVTILARGTGQQIRGAKKKHARPYLILGDDIESDEDAVNPTQIEKNSKWLNKEVIGALSKHPRGRIILIANLLAEGSFTHRLSTSDNWHTLFYSAMKQDGSMLFPDMYPEEVFLEEMRIAEEDGELKSFWLETMNLPYDQVSSSLSWTDIKYFQSSEIEAREVHEEFKAYVIIDPSFSDAKGSHYTGISYVLVDNENNHYHEEAIYSSSKEPVSLASEILTLVQRRKNTPVYVEAFGPQKIMIPVLRTELLKLGCKAEVRAMYGGNEKSAKVIRIRRYMVKIKNKKVFWCSESKGVKKAIREFVLFPARIYGGDHDVIDAISYANKVAIPPNMPEVKEEESFKDKILKQIGKHPKFMKGVNDGRI